MPMFDMFKCFFTDRVSCYKLFIRRPSGTKDKRKRLLEFADCIARNRCFQSMTTKLLNRNVLPCYYFVALFLSRLNNGPIELDARWGHKLLLPNENNVLRYGISSGLSLITDLNYFRENSLAVLYTLNCGRGAALDSYIEKRRNAIIKNDKLCGKARETGVLALGCLVEHVFLFLGDNKVVGANFPSHDFIYADVKDVLRFDVEGKMSYTWNNGTKYYLFASGVLM